jgi:hypothetical protein
LWKWGFDHWSMLTSHKVKGLEEDSRISLNNKGRCGNDNENGYDIEGKLSKFDASNLLIYMI